MAAIVERLAKDYLPLRQRQPKRHDISRMHAARPVKNIDSGKAFISMALEGTNRGFSGTRRRTDMKQAESSHHPLPPHAGKDSEHICIKRKYLIWFLLVSPVLIILLLVLEHHFIPQITHLPYPTSISEFANQFILASTLFTGLVITILLQYTQCKQLSEQQCLMNRQMFENSFYNQLHHLHNLVNNTQITFYRNCRSPYLKTGHEGFSHLFDVVQSVGLKLQNCKKRSLSEENTIRQADASISPFLRSFFSFAHMLFGNANFSGEEREHYVSLLSDSLSFKEAYILGIYGRTYQFNYAEKKINEVLTYMNRRRLWQKDVIQDVFGSQSIFSIFKAVVNRDNKDLPEE